jgi:hypothetical protein
VPGFLGTREWLKARQPWFLAAMARQKAASRVHRSRLALESLSGLRYATSR